MSNSPLIDLVMISPNSTNPRNHAIDTITIHHTAGVVDAQTIGEIFQPVERNASCNYGVGCDGKIVLVVDEANRSWCSADRDNDNRAITLEVSNSSTGGEWPVSDMVLSKVIQLCADICQRNGIAKLRFTGDLTGNMTLHKWFDNTECPGPYLESKMPYIAQEVNKILGAQEDTSDAKKIWDYFMTKIGNAYGVAGLMGNLEAESGFHCDRVQGDIPYSNYSQQYTWEVDNGLISKTDFANNGPGGGGYGLAQWTWPPRKKALYEMWVNNNYPSIGSVELACDYLWYELQTDYASVLSVLKTATNIRTASDKVLHDFENPADQSTAVEEKRASMGQVWYDKYHNSTPGGGTTPDDPTPPIWTPKKTKALPLWLIATATRRR